MSLASARSALIDLEELGYVTPDVDGARQGKTEHYTADRVRLSAAIGTLLAYVIAG